MTLSRFCPWKDHLFELEELEKQKLVVKGEEYTPVLYVLYGDTSGSWRIQVPNAVSKLFN